MINLLIIYYYIIKIFPNYINTFTHFDIYLFLINSIIHLLNNLH